MPPDPADASLVPPLPTTVLRPLGHGKITLDSESSILYILRCKAYLTWRTRDGCECEALCKGVRQLNGGLLRDGADFDVAAKGSRALDGAVSVCRPASDSVSV